MSVFIKKQEYNTMISHLMDPNTLIKFIEFLFFPHPIFSICHLVFGNEIFSRKKQIHLIFFPHKMLQIYSEILS